MKFNWPKRLTSAEKLDKRREETMWRERRNVIPNLLTWDYSSTSDGYKYIEHQIGSLPPQHKHEILHRLEREHGFIIMKNAGSHYLVVSDSVAAGRESDGWTRVTTTKAGLPLPCQGE